MQRQRRLLLKAGAAAPAGLLLTGCQGQLDTFQSWRQAREAVLELLFKPQRLDGSSWNLAQMLQHAAQSIEYSMVGYPELKSALFRATAGKAAFAVFDARGRMSHDLQEPIPGAPALDARLTLKTAVQRLLDAMQAFSSHQGALRPHFAYGELSRLDYQRAHLMHLANHWTQLQPVSALA